MQRLVLVVCLSFVAASAMAADTTWREFGSKRGTVLDANVSSLDLSKTYPTMWVRLRFPALESGAVRTVAQYEFDCEEEEMHLLSEQSFDADGELVSAHEMGEDDDDWTPAGDGTFGGALRRYVCDAAASMEE